MGPENSSHKLAEIQVGRLLTLTTKGTARWNDTNFPIAYPTSLRVTEVIKLRGTKACLVTGFPVRRDGTNIPEKSAREVLVMEGSFFVWW